MAVWIFLFSTAPTAQNSPNSYWKCVSRHICSLICATYHQQVGTKNIPLMFTLAFLQGKFANCNYISLFSSKKTTCTFSLPSLVLKLTTFIVHHLHFRKITQSLHNVYLVDTGHFFHISPAQGLVF